MAEILSMPEAERRTIVDALRMTQDVTLAAVGLLISRSTLYRKIRSYEILPEEWKGHARSVRLVVDDEREIA